MKDFITILMYAGFIIFISCFVVGIFRARADIRKHKNDDCSFRQSRKDVIAEKAERAPTLINPADALDAYNSLSEEQREQFKRELLSRFQQKGSD